MSIFGAVKLRDTSNVAQGVNVVDGVIPVSGPATDVELRDTALPVTGDVLLEILGELKKMNVYLSVLANIEAGEVI